LLHLVHYVAESTATEAVDIYTCILKRWSSVVRGNERDRPSPKGAQPPKNDTSRVPSWTLELNLIPYCPASLFFAVRQAASMSPISWCCLVGHPKSGPQAMPSGQKSTILLVGMVYVTPDGTWTVGYDLE
jgi:hypothetical protein